MELSELKNKILTSFEGKKEDLEKILSYIEKDNSVFPFNEYEHLLHHLISIKGLSFNKYLEIRTEYINANPNLWIFEISAPRGFGEKFAQTYIHGMCNDLEKTSKKLDSTYSGEYDLWLNGIKIEVKASRCVDSNSKEPLYIKALSTDTSKPFLMNFQQLKPNCCDVFIWVAVFRDKIMTWVISSKEVQNHRLFSKGQHRGNHGNEGQMHITQKNINELEKYLLKSNNLKAEILKAAQK